MTTVTDLECSVCGRRYELSGATMRCACGGALLVRYDLELAQRSWSREWIHNGPHGMWRYTPLLPARKPASVVSLGEGMTPLVRLRRSEGNLWIKDEGLNPTGSFEARGMACAISMASEFGTRAAALEAGGDAARAFAAYTAAAGISAHIALAPGAARSDVLECQAFGALIVLAGEAGTLPDLYRIEGYKTIGYELAEQLSWRPPDVIVCPRGSSLVQAAMAKGFDELDALGWIAGARPRMIEPGPEDAADAIGTGLKLAAEEGVFAAPEGAACLAAVRRLLAAGTIEAGARVVVLNPAAGSKRLETYAKRFASPTASEADKLGGLITPR
jgi:threonine synthase